MGVEIPQFLDGINFTYNIPNAMTNDDSSIYLNTILKLM